MAPLKPPHRPISATSPIAARNRARYADHQRTNAARWRPAWTKARWPTWCRPIIAKGGV